MKDEMEDASMECHVLIHMGGKQMAGLEVLAGFFQQ